MNEIYLNLRFTNFKNVYLENSQKNFSKRCNFKRRRRTIFQIKNARERTLSFEGFNCQ